MENKVMQQQIGSLRWLLNIAKEKPKSHIGNLLTNIVDSNGVSNMENLEALWTQLTQAPSPDAEDDLSHIEWLQSQNKRLTNLLLHHSYSIWKGEETTTSFKEWQDEWIKRGNVYQIRPTEGQGVTSTPSPDAEAVLHAAGEAWDNCISDVQLKRSSFINEFKHRLALAGVQWRETNDLMPYWKHRCKLAELILEATDKQEAYSNYIRFLAGKPIPKEDIRPDNAVEVDFNQPTTGAKWVKAQGFKYIPRKKYYAKWMLAGSPLFKSTGWFQESDGTFFWNEQGYVPIGANEYEDLYILDESESSPESTTTGVAWVSGKKRLPNIDEEEDFPRQYTARGRGDDPRSGWVWADLLTASELREVNEDDYWEWCDESSPAQPSDAVEFAEWIVTEGYEAHTWFADDHVCYRKPGDDLNPKTTTPALYQLYLTSKAKQ